MGRDTRGRALAIKPVGAVVLAAALLLLLGLWAAPQAMTGGRAKELAERALAEDRLGLPEGGDFSGAVLTVRESLQGSLPKGHHLVSATEKGLTSWFLLTEQPGGKGDFLYLGQSFGDEAAFSIADMGGEQCPFTFSYAGDWNNFLSLEPVDTDGDGICELLAWENAFLSSPFLPGSLNFGVFFTLLKYDPAAQGLSVVDSGFWARYSSGETLEEYVANRWR